MKKTVCFIFCVLVCLVLTACGKAPAEMPPSEAEQLPENEAPSTQESEQPQMSARSEENAPARTAYAAALKTLLDTNILPDGTGDADGYMGSTTEREAMAENKFSVYDVDGDGREELVLLYTTAIVAGQTGFVYDWDEAAGKLREQFAGFPNFTFYKSGALKVGWSHNQGKGGNFWPYDLYTYDAGADGYQLAGSVDAWDKDLGLEDYPSEVDVSKTGFVYYINRDLASEWEKIAPVDDSEYRAWLAPYQGEGGELSIPYDALTAENIQGLLAAG